MKSLEFHRDEKKDRITVACADGEVSVYSHCSYCRHCMGVQVGKRMVETPQIKAGADLRRGAFGDDMLMNAAMMFNTLVRDGSAIACNDDAGHGFQRRY